MKTLEIESVRSSANPIAHVPAKKKRRLGVITIAIVALVVLAGIWRMQARPQNDVSPFLTAKIARGDISETIDATGKLEPITQVVVGSELSGPIDGVYVQANDHVKKGEKLATLDTALLKSQTESARAAANAAQAHITESQATLDQTEADLQRKRELSRISGGQIPSKSEFDSATAAAARAVAALDSAKAAALQADAQVRLDETDLEKSDIRSPIDGVVLTRTVELGQTVAASFTTPQLFIIAKDLTSMRLRADVAEADVGRVDKGEEATFTVDAWPGRTYSASVFRVAFGSTVIDNVVTYQTELQAANADLTLRPGMTASVHIQIASKKNVLLVPTSCFGFILTPPAQKENGDKKDKSVDSHFLPEPPKRMDESTTQSSGVENGSLWVVDHGTPKEVKVKRGISDGRWTEVTPTDGFQLEDAEVILQRKVST